jgi:membrane protein DedA with SNARE-associated domain
MLFSTSATLASVIVLLSAWEQLQRWGGLGLIALGVLDSSFIPLPGSMDALTVVLATAQKSWWPYYALMATGGSVLGGYLTYRVGQKGGEEALEKKISKDRMERVRRAFEKGGFSAVFVPALLPPPVPMVPFLLTAGAMKYSTRKFLAALAAGRAARYFLLAFVASLYGRAILGLFAEYHTPVLWTLVGLAVVAGLAALGYWIYRRQTSRKQGRPRRKSGKDVAA